MHSLSHVLRLISLLTFTLAEPRPQSHLPSIAFNFPCQPRLAGSRRFIESYRPPGKASGLGVFPLVLFLLSGTQLLHGARTARACWSGTRASHCTCVSFSPDNLAGNSSLPITAFFTHFSFFAFICFHSFICEVCSTSACAVYRLIPLVSHVVDLLGAGRLAKMSCVCSCSRTPW